MWLSLSNPIGEPPARATPRRFLVAPTQASLHIPRGRRRRERSPNPTATGESHRRSGKPASQYSCSLKLAMEFLSIAAGVGGLPVEAGVGKVELVRLVAALRCNAQGLVDVENQRRGDVLIAPADFNHSWSVPCLD